MVSVYKGAMRTFLNTEQMKEIYRMLNYGALQKDIAGKFNISQGNVSRIAVSAGIYRNRTKRTYRKGITVERRNDAKN